MSTSAAANEVFAANRADGRISLAIAATPSGPRLAASPAATGSILISRSLPVQS